MNLVMTIFLIRQSNGPKFPNPTQTIVEQALETETVGFQAFSPQFECTYLEFHRRRYFLSLTSLMEKREAADRESVNTYLHNLQLNHKPDTTKFTQKSHAPTLQSFGKSIWGSILFLWNLWVAIFFGLWIELVEIIGLAEFSSLVKRERPPSLVSLCIGVVGGHLEDIIDDLAEITSTFPSDIKVKDFSIILILFFKNFARFNT